MSFETYIARRYFMSGRFFVSVSTWFSILGVLLGVATVCFVMSMHNGFEAEIRSRLLGTSAHISIFPLGEPFFADYNRVVAEVETLDHVLAASPFVYYKAAISSASSGDGIVVRGIDRDRERLTSDIEASLQVGQYSFDPMVQDGDTLSGILLGKGLASRLGVFIDDNVVLYSLQGEELRKGSRPRVKKFYVSGIFESGMYEFDGSMAYVSLEDAQELFKLGDVATAVHLKLDDIHLAETIAPLIDSTLGFQFDVVPWNILHRNLFAWIAMEKLVLFIGFSLIVMVAAFSIISTLVMTTMEKRSEIGILKTIGSTGGAVRRIFVYKALLIATIGVVGGWILAYGVGLAQNHWQIVQLPPDIYFISYLPIDPHWLDYFAAGGVTFIICFLAALYPAYQAARLSVIDVLRQ